MAEIKVNTLSDELSFLLDFTELEFKVELEKVLSEHAVALNREIEIRTDDVSNPPLDSELDAIFGTPDEVGAGFKAYIDDDGAGANFYQVVSDSVNWWIFTGVKAA